MPSKTITILSLSCGALFAAYVALVAVTMYYASSATGLYGQIRELESEVAALETDYYDAISRISGADVYAHGYVTPALVEYVAKGGEPALTRADR